MNEPRFTEESFEVLWQKLDEEGRDWKLANHALVEMQKIYLDLSLAEQQAVDSLMASWILSDNVRKQFDAEGMINQFGIRCALPMLRTACESAVAVTDAPTVQRRAKLERLIERLERVDESSE